MMHQSVPTDQVCLGSSPPLTVTWETANDEGCLCAAPSHRERLCDMGLNPCRKVPKRQLLEAGLVLLNLGSARVAGQLRIKDRKPCDSDSIIIVMHGVMHHADLGCCPCKSQRPILVLEPGCSQHHIPAFVSETLHLLGVVVDVTRITRYTQSMENDTTSHHACGGWVARCQ